MSLVTQVSDLAVRVGTEFKSVRTEIDAIDSGATNLAATLSATNTIITSDTGTDATIPAVDATNAGVMTPTMKSKLDGIEALADVTDAANVDAAGAVMNADTSTASMSFVIDEDSFASDSATKVPTQQSTKAYIVSSVAALVASAPGTLDTLDELAAALGDDASFATTTATALGNRVRVDTAAQGLNGTQQSNARTNIDVYSKSEIGSPTTDFVATFEAALV
jgi:hypothetical protein